MIRDKENLFSDAQALTTTGVSTNVIDLGANRDIGKGNELELLFTVTTALAGGTSVIPILITSLAEDMSSPTTLWTGPTLLTAALVAGYQIKIRVPRGVLRYLRMNYTISGTYTSGNVSAGILIDVDDYQVYPKATEVLA